VSVDAERRSPPVPHLGRRTEEAFAYALAVHAAQVRKRAAVPYVSHLLAVASIVLEDGGDEDATVAALLHDAVEDQGGLPRLEDIEHRFGGRVAEIVAACSDSLAEDPNTKEGWEDRKRAYLDRLRDESDPSVLRVALADKLHNARCVATDAARDTATWDRYNAAPDRVAWYYGECLAILRERHGGSRFIDELELAVARVTALAAAAPPRPERGAA
jgi:(p)ppGpp synthase/HD superfamily hydrolase